jgi:hypothetical protein
MEERQDSQVRDRETTDDAATEAPAPEGPLPADNEPEMARLEYVKFVYERPKPNANRGMIFALSKCL